MEFIGRHLEVRKAKNLSLEGLAGEVVEETKSSFVLDTPKGRKRVLKDQATFRVKIGGRTAIINGSLLTRRPEDRIKTR